MGTEKRERQKAGRAARVEAAMVAQKRADGRRRIVWIVGTVVFAGVLIGLAALLLGEQNNDDGAEAASSSTRPSTSSTTLPSVEGAPCVEFADTLPPGAPAVPVVAGPPPTELQTTDVIEGTGEAVTADATITVDYIGVSCSTGMIFDASYGSGQEATFPLSQVIPGWTEGIPGMKVGGQRMLVIPPDKGYGETGSPPSIAPGETLWFVVDLKAIAPADGAVPPG